MQLAIKSQQWAIPIFNHTPLRMTINGVQGEGGGHLNTCPGGLQGIIEVGAIHLQVCPGGGWR